MEQLSSNTEEEIKVLFPDVETALRKIRTVAKYVRTLYIRDVIYGIPTEAEKKKVRLRYEDNLEYVSIDATYKYKVSVEGGIKKEIEETIYKGSSIDEAVKAIHGQGAFAEENSYEKIRILFSDKNETEYTVDVYPYGALVEIEGKPTDIHAAASKLGFSPRDYIQDSADELYLAWIKKHGLPEQWDVRFGLTGKR